jgi:hypothetical protein
VFPDKDLKSNSRADYMADLISFIHEWCYTQWLAQILLPWLYSSNIDGRVSMMTAPQSVARTSTIAYGGGVRKMQFFQLQTTGLPDRLGLWWII